MNTSPLLLLSSAALALSAGAWRVLGDSGEAQVARPGAESPEPAGASGGSTPDATRPLADEALAPHRRRLLDLAFTTASALPLHPHLKERSRLQEEVVEACLALGQLRAARGYLDPIANWRRGSAAAELAARCVEAGALDEARACLELARGVADDIDRKLAQELAQELDPGGVESPQDWHRDRIRVRMARALFLNGEAERAGELEAGVVESEAGKVDAVRARRASVEDFEVLIAALESEVVSASFERALHALEACAELFDRFYDDPERRARAEAALCSSGAKLPESVLIGLLRRAAEIALDHGDREKGLELVLAADARVQGKCGTEAGWIPEDEVPLRAALVGLRARAGDRAGAEQELAAAARRYDEVRDEIGDFYRAETVRPLAEAAYALGHGPRALAFYRRAVEEGALNPNARQRAEDLVATCLSLARLGVEPDADLWQRILAIRAGLAAPW